MNGDDQKRLWEDIGSIKAGVEGLQGTTAKIEKKVDRLTASAVRRSECKENRDAIVAATKRSTGRGYPAVAAPAAIAATSGQATPSEPKSLLQRAKENAAAIATILGLLGLLGGAVWRGATFLAELKAAARKQELLIKRLHDRRARSIPKPAPK